MATVANVPFIRFTRDPALWPPAVVPTYDGLTAFAPLWGIAAFFSIAGDPQGLIGGNGALYALLAWGVVATSAAVILFPRNTSGLLALASVVVLLYVVRLPVASNNKTITVMFDIALLLSAVVLAARSNWRGIDRVLLYEHCRISARWLLAIMYFYGIFHKINTDFLDPTVSCAVGLYRPLAAPFGLDDNLFGRYLAIAATFGIEAIAIVSLFWKKYFAVGLIISLVFHYIIPISAYSWYMDFSSLVFALYILSMPREASGELYAIAYRHVVHPLRMFLGRVGILVPIAAVLLLAGGVIALLAVANPGRPALMLLHSIFILVWAVVGGAIMVAMTYVALRHLPYAGVTVRRVGYWIYIIPALFFISCLSPYVGLKTESSINMFSNLHTEGGTTNHLLFSKPPYLFDYQREIVRVVDSSSPSLRKTAAAGRHNVLFSIEEFLRRHPDQWVSYVHNGKLVERATAASLGLRTPSLLERKLLIFKQVDPVRPKVCTH